VPIVAGALLAKRYRAEALLGRGGMGEVWRCFDIDEEREVAIKAIRAEFLSDPGAARLFHSEVVAVARLNHPGIIPVYDLIRDPNSATLLVMAYRDGPSLGSLTNAELTWSFIVEVLAQLLEALAYAHARGVLHLDIKPENVLVEQRESQLRATLLDFGIARVRRPGRGIERWFERDAVIGTVEYMAPEQCSGTFERLGPWSDLFSVGAMAYELCCGQRAFPGASQPTAMVRRLTDPPPRLHPNAEGVPPDFADLCATLLANEPRDRPLNAAEALQLLRAVDPAASRVLLSCPIAQPTAEAVTARETSTTSATVPLDAMRSSFPAASELPPVPPFSLPFASGHFLEITFSGEAEEAFTADPEMPSFGAYGLFGLRDLPVLGRTEERRAVWNAVKAVVLEQRPRLLLLEGPAGVGKSRLARDAMERAVELGICVPMQTSWSPDGSGDEGLRGLLENLLDTRGTPAPQVQARLDFWLDRIPGEHHAFSREIELSLRPPRNAAPDADLPVRTAIEAIARATTLRPVLLWLDDVQWSRGEAETLLSALSAKDPPLAVCVIATVRAEEIGDLDAYKALTQASFAERVRLDPLDLEATQRLVRGLLDVDEELCDFLSARAEGNPLFVTQLVRQLVIAEAVERRDGRYRLTRAFDLSSVPADIRAVWNRRVDQSGARERDLGALALVRDRVSLEVAEEMGRTFAMKGSGHSSWIPPPSSGIGAPVSSSQVSSGRGRVSAISFETSLARALSAGLLRIEGGAYVWTHGLLREHLLKSLHPETARELHAIAAAALAPLIDREDVQEERALHLRRAGQAREACESMLEAGLWSFRRADAAPRRARFEALASWAREGHFRDLEARALAELAYAAAEIGEGARADQVIAAARAIVVADGGGKAASWVAMRSSQIWRSQAQTAQGTRATEEALRLARATGVGEVERVSLLQLGLDHWRSGELSAARDVLQEASALCRASFDRINESVALRVMSELESSQAALAMLERSIDLARAAGALRIELSAKLVWVDRLWRAGTRDVARRHARDLTEEAARRRLRHTVSVLAIQSAAWAASERDWADARAHRDKAAEWGAASGAAVERVGLSALDALFAVVANDERAASAAVAALEHTRDHCEDATIREVLDLAAAHASPLLAPRLRKLSRPMPEAASR
jgi:serine/threonine protein kinase